MATTACTCWKKPKRAICSSNPACSIVSGERRSQRVLAAAELEPDGYLIKPFTGEQLRVRLDRAMRRREAFRCVDDALKQNDLLVAISSCNDKISRAMNSRWISCRLRGSLSLKIGDYLSAKSLYEEVMAIKGAAVGATGPGQIADPAQAVRRSQGDV